MPRERILAEVGVSKMTFHGRFGFKAGLVREVLRQEGAAWRRTFFGAVEAVGPDAAGHAGPGKCCS